MGNGVSWTREQKNEACLQYQILGAFNKTSKATGIPHSTLLDMSKTEEWVELATTIRDEKSNEHRAQYVAIIDKAQAVTLDKLGDATAAQANIIAATATDKVRLHDGQPTSIQGQSSDMKSLANEFRKLSQQWDEKQVNVIKTIDKKKGPI